MTTASPKESRHLRSMERMVSSKDITPGVSSFDRNFCQSVSREEQAAGEGAKIMKR